MDIPILYEDDDVVIIHKPSGLVVHPDGKTIEPSVSAWLLETYPNVVDVGEPLTLSTGEIIHRPGIVHRLDRDTSGVLLAAKNQNAYMHMKAQFQNRNIEKVYRAFVYGEIKEKKGVIDKPIGRHGKDYRLRSSEDGARGNLRDAITEYSVLQKGKGVSYVNVRPQSGRTHQIRVHFKAINHPVVCDPLYAPKRECIVGFKRLALHAFTLELTLPNGIHLLVEAPLPPDFEAALNKLT